MCQLAYASKLTSTRKDWKELAESLGWTSTTVSPYIKVGEWIVEIEPENLELLDINTIKSLCCEKYRPILERLKSDRLTVAEVREEMRAINEATKQTKQPSPVLEWKRAKSGDRSLIIHLQDADAGAEFEAKYKESCQPLPLFIRDLLRQEPAQTDTWQKANQELAAYIETQIDEVAEIEKKIEQCNRLIAKFANSTNASEIMVRRVATEDKAKLQAQLNRLLVVAA